jgi:(1->4)-alpha-D-glucan 1-alpha-D-glucosylmutase
VALPRSTYRLQVRPSFDLYAVADACDYLATLGVDAVYLSPLLPSSRGSDHGYDVVAHDTIDAARGGLDGWTRALAAARSRGLKQVIDIVPNHVGVARAEEMAAWWAMLRDGPGSPFASWFDVDWAAGGGRVLLPVLGDGFTADQLTVADGELHYAEHRFPLAAGTEGGTAAEVHDRQHYQLVDFRRADTDQNYRRFFAVTTLAGLRVEDPAVFAATHLQIERWLREEAVDGLRVDHPDGLTDPGGYLTRLRALAGERAWLLVEKILATGEDLPESWPVDGDTGYAALAEAGGVLIDPAAGPAFDALYRQLTGDERTAVEHAIDGKRLVATTILRAEVSRLARLTAGIPEAAAALCELLVTFPVYRSYLPEGADRLAAALGSARSRRPELTEAFDALAGRLGDPVDELSTRFQQASSAVMAKGVEDTAYYRYTRFVALNEVGGDPARFGLSLEQFHAAQRHRQRRYPRGMTTVSTHDTKRGEDVRARLAALAELPEAWASTARTLLAAAPIPDRSFAYLLWQTFAGVGFVERSRLHAYAEKAMREAAQSTSWVAPDAAFEAVVHAAVDAAYDDPAIHEPLATLIGQLVEPGWSNALAQKLVQLTMPGVPDVYQGTEVWQDSLVDPDNRRPVDLAERRALLERLDADDKPPPVDASGAAKLWVLSRTLRTRRDRPELFASYTPLAAHGPAADHVLAFDRGGAVTVVTRLPVGLARAGGWRDTVLALPAGEHTDVFTGQWHRGSVQLADLLGTYPVALLTTADGRPDAQ